MTGRLYTSWDVDVANRDQKGIEYVRSGTLSAHGKTREETTTLIGSPTSVQSDNSLPGSPVSTALILPTGKIRPQLQAALNAVDSVHSDGSLTIIPVRVSNSRKRYAGKYQSLAQEGVKPTPLRILISRHSKNIEFSFLHEIGHFLDEQGWPGEETASESFFHRWGSMVYQSTPIQDLIKMYKAGVGTALFSDGGSGDMPVDRDYVEYLLEVDEIWARTYAQYVTTRSEDAILRQQLQAHRTVIRDEIYYPDYWADHEFEPIMEEMDTIFERRGWR